jgi:DNA-directed RNA polymerase subunit RPC12/RpoP
MSAYVAGDGTPRKFQAQTDIPCPVCNPGMDSPDPRRYLAVLFTSDNTSTLECPNCGHTVHMHRDHAAQRTTS